MKKLIRNLSLFLLPFIIYFLVFIFNDPNNFFGLNEKYYGFNSVLPIARIREFINSDNNKIIIGDSRIDQFYGNYQDGFDFSSYDNLAFGGELMNESIELFWFAANQKELDEVIFQISFYTLNTNYKSNRIKGSINASENPLRYFLSYNANIDFLQSLRSHVDSFINVYNSPNETTEINATDKEILLEQYSQQIKNVVLHYQVDQEYLNQLIDISEYCTNNDIKLIFVIPPIEEHIWDNVIFPLNIDEDIYNYKTLLSNYSLILDMEIYQDIIKSNDFVDGFHFIGDLEKEYMDMILNNEGKNYEKWGEN